MVQGGVWIFNSAPVRHLAENDLGAVIKLIQERKLAAHALDVQLYP